MKLKKFRKQLQKDLSKAFGFSRKELFSKKVHYTLAEEVQSESIKEVREVFEEYIKEKFPEFKDVEFKWEELL